MSTTVHAEALKAYKQKDYTTAMNLWLSEAESNDQAMANLGIMYLKGDGVEKDYDKAREWFEKSSEHDNDSANFNLGLMYQTKLGVEEDVFRAIEYYRKAVTKNHAQAAFRLALLLLADRSNIEQVKEGFDCMIKAARGGNAMANVQLTGLDKEIPTDVEINTAFRDKSKEEQLEVINDALDRYIRPILIKDGGNITLLDFVTHPEYELRLAYQGACAGCSLSTTSTYAMIEDTINNVIDKAVRLYIL